MRYSLVIIYYSITPDFYCYSCTYTQTGAPEVGAECMYKPWNVTTGSKTIKCKKDSYCVTVRIHLVGKSVQRGYYIKESKPVEKNRTIETRNYQNRIYHKATSLDLEMIESLQEYISQYRNSIRKNNWQASKYSTVFWKCIKGQVS